MFNVRYVASACLVISTSDVRILCDPWFTDGIYDGSWYTYPKVSNPIELIGDVDCIYISHIHPDHYDPTFLRSYFYRYGDKPLLIPNHFPNHLFRKAILDGFQPTVIESKDVGDTAISIVPNSTGSASDIDSALVVSRDGISFLNLNDNIFNQRQNQTIKALLKDLRFAAIGYSSAGPYPQTYFSDLEALLEESKGQKERAVQKFLTYLNEFQPKAALPFAGQYLLGGRLHTLNKFRGCPDAVELLPLDERVIVLSDNSSSYYDLERQQAVGSVRVAPLSEEDLSARTSDICDAMMSYETELSIDLSRLPIENFLRSAYLRAHDKSECNVPYYFFIQTSPGTAGWLLSADRNSKHFEAMEESTAIEFAQTQSATLSILTIDFRLLFGLTSGIYHWNNAEIGSQYLTRRIPNLHNRAAQRFLNFLRVI